MTSLDFTKEYCPKCEKETLQRVVNDDPYFIWGLECLNCHMIWESEKPIEDDEGEDEDEHS